MKNKYLSLWKKESMKIDWIKPWQTITSGSFKNGNIKWFEDGYLNACFNCVDRHAINQPEKIAIIWEPEDKSKPIKVSYRELLSKVSQVANIYKKLGVKKGDIITIYMPMTLEAIYSILACSRLGAIHSVIFAGFSTNAIKDRLEETKSKFIVTSHIGYRSGKILKLKQNIDIAIANNVYVEKVLVFGNPDNKDKINNPRDIIFNRIKDNVSDKCPIVSVNSEDPLFILYTSGSTGKPKGIQHSTGGYLVYASYTHRVAFNLNDEDIYWCTADIGWITGHSYVVYGPLCNGGTNVIYEGSPNYPNYDRYFRIIDKYNINIFYTAPTAIRLLMSKGSEILKSSSRNSLRILGTVGEPIDKKSWQWLFNEIGNRNCPIIDTWWQTETGGIMLSPPVKGIQKPGSVMNPIKGISPIILNRISLDELENSQKIEKNGVLAIKEPWPGIMRTIFNNHDRYMNTYFNNKHGYYIPSDGAYQDPDNHYWITGRLDDVINISGHRIGTAEIENIINAYSQTLECAAIGIPDNLRGESLYIFIVIKNKIDNLIDTKQGLKNWLRLSYGSFLHIDNIQICTSLPKTRSGKIMRRVLRKIATDKENEIGDTSTITDETCIKLLIKGREKILFHDTNSNSH